jgi:hypothetical protein
VSTNYRLVGPAERQIDRILLESAREWGIEAAAGYQRLFGRCRLLVDMDMDTIPRLQRAHGIGQGHLDI